MMIPCLNASSGGHHRDAHCEDAGTLDDEDNCTMCGATTDGGECGECGGTRFHEPTCPGAKGESPAPRICDPVPAGPRTEQAMEDWLECAIMDASNQDGTNVRVNTFEEQGIMTRNRGLVVRFGSTEFQLTIVRSAR